MNKNKQMTPQVRFTLALNATWSVLHDPVLTRVYMAQWENMYPRPLSVEGEELSLYGYVFHVMYKAV